MNRSRKQLVCAVVLFFAVSSQEQAPGQNPQAPQPDKKSAVQIFLTVSGQHDSLATPAQSELSISVDNQPAQVNMLRSAKDVPMMFVVLVDASKSDIPSATSIKKAASQLFQSLSGTSNQGYLGLFSSYVGLSRQPLQATQAQNVLDAAQFGGITALYDAIKQVCTLKLSRAGNPDTPRRAIFLISDGGDNASQLTHTAAEEAAEKEGVMIFSLIIQSSPADHRAEHILQEISQQTGGLAIRVKNPTDGVGPLLTAVEDQWELSFVPGQSLDQKKAHTLRVTTSQKDISLSAPAHVFVQ